MPIVLLELMIAPCSGLQMLSRLFHAHRHIFVCIVFEISIVSEPAKIDFCRTFNLLKHKNYIHIFLESASTAQIEYNSGICNT